MGTVIVIVVVCTWVGLIIYCLKNTDTLIEKFMWAD